MVLYQDGYLYTGCTGNLQRRGNDRRRRHGIGFKMVYKESFDTRERALERESQIKGWSRAKKEALYEGKTAELRRLAKRRAGKSI
jgi:predicted GIY-YIG superfamily endonuclease